MKTVESGVAVLGVHREDGPVRAVDQSLQSGVLFPDLDLRGPPRDRDPQLMTQLRELRTWIAAFLQIEVSTTIQRFYDDLFSSFAGEQNKRQVRILSADRLQEFYAVHLRHLIVAHDRVEIVLFKET